MKLGTVLRQDVNVTVKETVEVIVGYVVSLPWTITVTVVPPSAGSVGFKVILPVDAFIASHVGMIDGVVIEYALAPQKSRP